MFWISNGYLYLHKHSEKHFFIAKVKQNYCDRLSVSICIMELKAFQIASLLIFNLPNFTDDINVVSGITSVTLEWYG